MMYQIESRDGTIFGTYNGETPEDAFAAMVTDGMGDAETAGTVDDWIIVPVREARKMTLIINELNCNGEGREFEAWVRENHPEIEIDYRENVGGVDGGLYDEDGEPVDYPVLWDEYCNS